MGVVQNVEIRVFIYLLSITVSHLFKYHHLKNLLIALKVGCSVGVAVVAGCAVFLRGRLLGHHLRRWPRGKICAVSLGCM